MGWVIESSGRNGYYGYEKMKGCSGMGIGCGQWAWRMSLGLRNTVIGTFRLHVSISSRWSFNIAFSQIRPHSNIVLFT